MLVAMMIDCTMCSVGNADKNWCLSVDQAGNTVGADVLAVAGAWKLEHMGPAPAQQGKQKNGACGKQPTQVWPRVDAFRCILRVFFASFRELH